MEWVRCNDCGEDETYTKQEVFNGFTYYLEAWIDKTFKTEIFWFAMSSGKKRKELKIFEEKENKSSGGIKPLLWAKKEILNFPEFIKNPLNKKQYLAISWSDSRRRDIYKRLEREGFQFQIIDKQKVLIKKLWD
jgi:hypothetical protein